MYVINYWFSANALASEFSACVAYIFHIHLDLHYPRKAIII